MSVMLVAALMLLAQTSSHASTLERDRADFEKTWPAEAIEAKEAGITKELAWQLNEWSQLQFSAGYCAAYIDAETANKIRRFPEEQDLMKTEAGRMLLKHSSDMFADGLAYRSEVAPSRKLCQVRNARPI